MITPQQFSYLIIAIGLVFLDKIITLITIIEAGKNYPEKDKFSIEKNPLAKYFMVEFGLTAGTILYSVFSLFTFFFSVWLLSFMFSYLISFTIVSLLYILVIINNIRWLIKYSR